MRIAIFDFDGTLYASETFRLLMNHLKQHPKHRTHYKTFLRKVLPAYTGYKMKLVPEVTMKEKSMRYYVEALQHLTLEQLTQFFSELKEDVQQQFNQQVLSKVHEHHRNDVHTLLVSGAYTSFLQQVTGDLPFQTIIGTEIPITNGKINPQKLLHIQGYRKNEKIKEAFAGQAIDWKNSFAYGDSYSDISVLELVGNPVAVNPKPQLQDIAKKRQWTII